MEAQFRPNDLTRRCAADWCEKLLLPLHPQQPGYLELLCGC
jgi:hypothetical protein